jgi:xylan 1,4-beta-xylosidase
MRLVPTLAVLFPALVCSAAQSAPTPPTMFLINPHWIAIRFEPQYPHGRHTQNPLPGGALTLPLQAGQGINRQAGQTSGFGNDVADFRIPVPDAVTDAGIDEAMLLADVDGAGQGSVSIEGRNAEATSCPGEVCSRLRLQRSQLARMKSFRAILPEPVHLAELTVAFKAQPEGQLVIHGTDALSAGIPIVLVHTRERIAKPAGWKTNAQSGIELPAVTPLFDQFLRDTSICVAADGNYYMTGTTGGPEMMAVTSDLSVWKSSDLVHWSAVRDTPRQSTVVWNIDRDGTWMKPIHLRDGEPFRPLWAPEIHYINGTFWIPFSVPQHGITILRSTTGKAGGPYEIAIKPDMPLSTGIDASLFQDDDGTVYSLYGGGWIARMKPDMSGLAEPYRHIVSDSGREVGFEGVYLFKDKGRYYLSAADFVLGEYNTYIITAPSLDGPWSERYLAVPHAGHGNFFRDKNGRMWSTFFGNDRHAPFHAKPAIVPMMQDRLGRWRPDTSVTLPKPMRSSATVQLPGAIGPSEGEPQQVGVMPSSSQ